MKNTNKIFLTGVRSLSSKRFLTIVVMLMYPLFVFAAQGGVEPVRAQQINSVTVYNQPNPVSGTSIRNHPSDFSELTPEVSPAWSISRTAQSQQKKNTQIRTSRVGVSNFSEQVPEVSKAWTITRTDTQLGQKQIISNSSSKNIPDPVEHPIVSTRFIEVPEDWDVLSRSKPLRAPGGNDNVTADSVEQPVKKESTVINQADATGQAKSQADSNTQQAVADQSKIFIEVYEDWEVSKLSISKPDITANKSGSSVAKLPNFPAVPAIPAIPVTPVTRPAQLSMSLDSALPTALTLNVAPLNPEQLGDRKKLPHKIQLNGRMIPDLFAYETQTGFLLFQLKAIASLMGDSLSLDKKGNKVKYLRSRDGARFELNTLTGEVVANGRSVGFLKEISLIDLELDLFPVNAVQVFSGLLLNRNDEDQLIEMKLDKRLQYVTGFELYVNGQKLPYVNPEPQSLGHVLLLPLRAIVDELGSRLTVSDDSNIISVVRVQDNAQITLNLNTGLVQLNGNPVGTAPNIAYANRQQLLLPRESVASLTGTYVTVLPGSRRIDVDLDGELARIIHPGQSIRSRAASSPASVESVKAFYDSENRGSVVVNGYYSEYNLRMEYETPSTRGDDGFTPNWLQFSAESIDGWGVGGGDHYAIKREFDGVNVTRFSGVSYYNPVKDGLLVAVAGKPQSAVRALDNDHDVPVFDGQAAGLRYYTNEGDFELGLAARKNDKADFKALVASIYKSLEHPDFRFGSLSQRADLALGVFEFKNENSLGGRFSWDGRLDPTEKLSLFARSAYSTSEVTAGIEDEEQDFNINDIADSLSYGLGGSYRPHQYLSYGFNHSHTRRAVFEGDLGQDLSRWNETSSVSMAVKPFKYNLSPWTYFSWDVSNANNKEKIRRLSGQAVWRINEYNLLLKHVDQHAEENGKSWLSSLELSHDPWIKYFRSESNLKLTPRLSAWKGSESSSATLGALLAFDSGKLLGSRTHLGMSYGKNLGIQQLNNNEESVSQSGSDYFNAGLSYRFNRLLKFSSNYYSDLDGHDDAYASLTAYYEFNPPRHIKISRENAGMLTGQVFLDKNFDGIQQEEEQGIGGARVMIKGTRVGLNSDPNGRFTIQNLPVGVYRIVPDLSRMPLGYIEQSESTRPVKIGDAQITEIKIPVVRGHQLSGVVYVDENKSGKLDKGDRRLENIGLEISEELETASTAFGQFTFDFLPPGKYQISVQEDTLPAGFEVDPDVDLEITLSEDLRNKLFVRLREQAN